VTKGGSKRDEKFTKAALLVFLWARASKILR